MAQLTVILSWFFAVVLEIGFGPQTIDTILTFQGGCILRWLLLVSRSMVLAVNRIHLMVSHM